MLRNNLSIDAILLSMEEVLNIQYDFKYTFEVIENSRRKIENIYNIELKSDIYTLQAENRLIGNTLSTLVADITETLKTFALFTNITMFDKKFGQTLRDVNYLGFASKSLLNALSVLQDESIYDAREAFFPTIVDRVTQLEMSQIKRLLTIMCVLESLGIKEGVALIAQYLYLGCL